MMSLQVRIFCCLLCLICLGVTTAFAGGQGARSLADAPKFRKAARPIQGKYVVVLKPDVVAASANGVAPLAEELTHRYGGRVLHIWEHALKGYAVSMTDAQARALSLDPSVAWVEEEGEVKTQAVQEDAPWGLDRIDQRGRPLNQRYNYQFTGKGVHVYVIDTGIRASHQEFGGRVQGGYSNFEGHSTGDGHGHGTAVASVIGGATLGVAKEVTLIPVRVNFLLSGFIDGVNWVASHATHPAVVNMSLEIFEGSAALDEAVQNCINAGITFVAAAGNDNDDACLHSPGRVPGVITVGSISRLKDVIYDNYGPCVDLFAPGYAIPVASITSDTETRNAAGTSVAAPHVTGVAAMYLQAHPSATPAEVAKAIKDAATKDVLMRPEGAGTLLLGTPNLLLYSNFVTCPAGFALFDGVCERLLMIPLPDGQWLPIRKSPTIIFH